jgi:adenosylcobinamide-GDP ribazoletransferase
LRNLLSAIRFLTLLPAGRAADFQPARMLPYFPLVGLLVGLLLAVFDRLAATLLSPAVAAVLDVVFLAVVSGGLHLDGLGDTADGLFSHRSREKCLAIMRDSRAGVMAVIAVVCTLAVKAAALTTVEGHRFLALLIVPSYSRSSMLLGIRLLPYGRPEGGIGTGFFQETPPPTAFAALALPFLLSLLLGWRAIALNGAFAVYVAGVLVFYRRRLGCVTGDMLGALCETCEAALFLALAAGNGF